MVTALDVGTSKICEWIFRHPSKRHRRERYKLGSSKGHRERVIRKRTMEGGSRSTRSEKSGEISERETLFDDSKDVQSFCLPWLTLQIA